MVDCQLLALLPPCVQAIAKQIGIIDEEKYAQGRAIVVKGERGLQGESQRPGHVRARRGQIRLVETGLWMQRRTGTGNVGGHHAATAVIVGPATPAVRPCCRRRHP